MPRHTRSGLNTSFFHVICQGINKEYIFNDESLKSRYLNLMKKYIKNMELEVICYCIMSNHVHILVYTCDITQLSNYMKCVNTEFAQYYNWLNKRVGFVFRDRFKSQPINHKKYLYQCINYIHMNPVRAKIVKNCGDYKYSSYNDFCKGKFLKGNFMHENINIKDVENVEKCSDFFDIDYNKDEVIKEYIYNYCMKNNMDIEIVKNDKVKRAELINVILKSGNIRKKDIQGVLNVSYWKIKQAIEDYK